MWQLLHFATGCVICSHSDYIVQIAILKLSIHFPAAAEPDKRRKILNIRYPDANDEVSAALNSMSGLAIRESLRVGNYAELASQARANRRSINGHVLALLESTVQQYQTNL